MDALDLAATTTFMLLTVSPALVFFRMVRDSSTGSFTPYPYVGLLLKCVIGIVYSLKTVTGGSNLFDAYLCGLVVECLVLILIIYEATEPQRAYVLIFVVFGLVIIFVTSGAVMVIHPPVNVRRTIIGSVFTAFTITAYIFPFAVCKHVYDTRRVEYMPLLPIIALLINSAIFFVISLREKDKFVKISSIVGLVSGTLQLMFFGTYLIIEKKDLIRGTSPATKPIEGDRWY